MRHALASLALAFLALACGPRAQGSGVSKTETRTLGEFSELAVSTGVEVEVHVGGATSVKVTGDDNIVPLVETEVSGKRLHVGFKSGKNINTKIPVHVDVATPDLSEIEASSGSHVKASGSAVMDLEVSASSGAHVDADQLAAKSAQVRASSGAHVTLHVADTVRGQASSGANVKVLGSPKTRSVTASSGADVSYP